LFRSLFIFFSFFSTIPFVRETLDYNSAQTGQVVEELALTSRGICLSAFLSDAAPAGTRWEPTEDGYAILLGVLYIYLPLFSVSDSGICLATPGLVQCTSMCFVGKRKQMRKWM
jgi:hypothetical protein